MIKKVFIYLILFFLICFFSNLTIKKSISDQLDNKPPYFPSFASIGANLLESRLDCWAKIKTATNDFDMDQALLKILVHLQIPADGSKFLHQDDGKFKSTEYDVQCNEINYHFLVQTDQTNQQTCFIMTAIDNRNYSQLQQLEKNLAKDMDCQAYYSYKGSIQAWPDDHGMEDILSTVMKNLGTDNHTIFHSQFSDSTTGYSSVWEPLVKAVEVDGQRCNVQAAVRRNTKNHDTEIYLGFPLLLSDY